MQTGRSLQSMQTKRAECGRAPLLLVMAPGPTDMNIKQAYHELTRIAATMHGGKPSEYNHTATWQCARNAVRMQRDLEALMRAHREFESVVVGRYFV